MREADSTALDRALDLSREMLTVAATGSPAEVSRLDAQRRGLLQSLKEAGRPFDERELSVLRTIADLNVLSLGKMEHRFRAICRDMDMLAAGRRALRAYGHNRP